MRVGVAPDVTLAAPAAPRVRRGPAGWRVAAAFATASIALGLRLVASGRLPGELYGDVTALLDYVGWILEGRWPTHFAQSAGPLYHYLAAPLLAITGLGYPGAKLCSILVSVGVLLATYGLALRLAGTRFALVATFIAGCSSWLLVFSRLGNSQILVPLLSTASLWLAVRAVQRGSAGDILGCAVASSLGLYAYPQSFILPAVSGLALVSAREHGRRVRVRHLVLFAGSCAILALPFLAYVASGPPELQADGYIGGKLHGERPLATLADNVTRAALAYWVSGDGVFRSNPPGVPHLDPVSGVLLVAGVLYWLTPRRRSLAGAIVLPFVLLHLPSVLVLAPPTDVPSASRTLAAAPLASILVASGVCWLATWCCRHRPPEPRRQPTLDSPRLSRGGLAVLLVALTAILAANVDRYFRQYAGGFPYGGTAVTPPLARWADRQPPGTHVYLLGCCWVHGMPEPEAVSYSVAAPERLVHLAEGGLDCDDLRLLEQPAALVWSFEEPLPDPRLTACAGWLRPEVARDRNGRPLFAASAVLATPLESLESRRAAATREGLVLDRGRLGSEAVAVLHTPFDLGSAAALLDGRPETVARSAIPGRLVLELHLPRVPTAGELILHLGNAPGLRAALTVHRPDGSTTRSEQELPQLTGDPIVTLPLPGGAGPVAVVELEVGIAEAGEGRSGSVHVRDLSLR